MKTLLRMVALTLLMVGSAHAITINIDAAATGCTPCNGNPHPAVGDILTSIISPVQLSFAPGMYTVTNGIGAPGANPGFGAWNYNSGAAGSNWIWDFLIINDANRQVVMDSCCGTQAYSTQAGAAASAHALNFSRSFTLTQQTTLDFVTEDYYPPDNLGGVVLQITPVPIPAVAWLLGTALGVLGLVRRKSIS